MLIRYYNNNGSSFLMLPSFGFSITLHYEYCFLDVIILLYLLVRIYKNYLLFFVIIIILFPLPIMISRNYLLFSFIINVLFYLLTRIYKSYLFVFVVTNIIFCILYYNTLLKTQPNQLMSANTRNVSYLLINFVFIMNF